MRLTILLSAFLAATTVLAESTALRLASPAYWCPYACDSKADKVGYAVEIALAALKTQNIEAHYINVPYIRIQKELLSGNIDGIIGSYKNETPSAIYPQTALFNSQFCFYSTWQLPFSWKGSTDALKKYKLIVTGGYSYSPVVNDYIATAPSNLQALTGQNITVRAFEMLENNRAQLFLEDIRVYEYQLKKQTINKANNLGCLNQVEQGFLALTSARPLKSQAIAEAFDQGMIELKKSNGLQKILEAYGIKSVIAPLKDH